MIKFVPRDEIAGIGSKIFNLAPDKPEQKKDIRKFLFFLFREGLTSTFRKTVARLKKQNKYDSSRVAARVDGRNALSFDGGVTFFISDIPKDIWESPFAYDYMGEPLSQPHVACYDQKPNCLYIVGYGNYAQTYTNTLKKKFHPRFFSDYNSQIISEFGNGFDRASIFFSELCIAWKQEVNPIAVIASFHSDHAKQAYELFKSNPAGFIFIEKPPLVDFSDIELFREMYKKGASLQIGFNRRHAPLAVKLKNELIPGAPKIIQISVNEVKITGSHWYLWGNQGTRITGNACHWIDLCQWFIGCNPVRLQLAHSVLNEDDCTLSIVYEDGSLASITLSDKGNDLRGVQEYIEVKQNNCTYRIDDMLSLTLDLPGKGRRKFRRMIRDKGHERMYNAFAHDVLKGKIIQQYPLRDLEVVTKVTFEFSSMLRNHVSEKILSWE